MTPEPVASADIQDLTTRSDEPFWMTTMTANKFRSGKSHRDENFPVASRLIHPRHRATILAFYNFVRTADDIAEAVAIMELHLPSGEYLVQRAIQAVRESSNLCLQLA